MTRFLGGASIGRATSYADRRNLEKRTRPFLDGVLWPRSRGMGGAFGTDNTLAGSRWAPTPTETRGGRGVAATPVLDRGHILDGNTIGLWRFDSALVPFTGQGFQDSTGTVMTYEVVGSATGNGVPGVTDYTPIPGQFARVFRSKTATADGIGHSLSSATSANAQASWIGSWTVEAYIRWDGNRCVVLGHVASGAGGAANNQLGYVSIVGPSGLMQYKHQSGANVSTFITSATAALTLGQWHYCAWVKDSVAKTVTFYLDGVQKDTQGYATQADTGTNGQWAIGRDTALPTTGTRSSMSLRDLGMHFEVKNQAWIDANWANFRSTGLLGKQGTSSLVRRGWTFADAPAAVDSSSYKHHLLFSGNDAAVTAEGGLIGDGGGHGRAVEAGIFFTYPSATILAAMLASFTLEVWINMSPPLPANGHGLFGFGDPSTENEEDNFFGSRVEAVNRITVLSESSSGVNGVTAGSSNNTVSLGVLHHIALRKTLTGATYTMDIFVNGVKIDTTAGQVNYTGGDNPEASFFKLLSSNTNSTFTGSVDDARLSNIARTDAEILESYQRGGFGGAQQAGYDEGYEDGYDDGYADGFAAGVIATTPARPTITIVSPTPGVVAGGVGGFPSDYDTAIRTPIVLDVTAPTGAALVVVVARYKNENSVERCIYRRGSFRRGFAAQSYAETIGAVLRLHVIPDGAWPSANVLDDVSFDVDAVGGIAGTVLSDIGASS